MGPPGHRAGERAHGQDSGQDRIPRAEDHGRGRPAGRAERDGEPVGALDGPVQDPPQPKPSNDDRCCRECDRCGRVQPGPRAGGADPQCDGEVDRGEVGAVAPGEPEQGLGQPEPATAEVLAVEP